MAQQALTRLNVAAGAGRLVFVLLLAGEGCGGAPAVQQQSWVDMDSPAPDLSLPGSSPDLRAVAQDAAIAPDLTLAPDLAGPVIVNQLAGVTVSTLAGSGVAGSQDGTGAAAQLNNPVGVALDESGTLYVTEYDGSRVRRVTPAGETTVLTSQTGFLRPFAVALNGPSRLVVQTDWDENGIKSATSGTLWNVSIDTGVATEIVTGLGRPRGLACLSAGNLVVSDELLNTLSMLNSTNGQLTPMVSPSLNFPVGVVVMPDGSFIVADSGNHCLRRVVGGQLSSFAGDCAAGMIDGPALSARFDRPIALSVDLTGNVYVSDQGNNHRIRRVTVSGMVETLAGNGILDFADGPGEQAEFYGQEGIAVLPAGDILYVADGNNGDGTAYHRVRKITLP